MKAKDLRERSGEDLKELEKSLAKDTFQSRFKNFTNRLDDTSAIKKSRRDLARVKTLLQELERGQKVVAKEKTEKAEKPVEATKTAAAAKSAAPRPEKKAPAKPKKATKKDEAK